MALLVTTVACALIVPLLPSALTVALLAAIESLLSAVAADNMAGDKHHRGAELVAQGLANLAAPWSAASRQPGPSPAPRPTSARGAGPRSRGSSTA